jgi:ATP-binding cassette subfamily F protein uup
LAERMQQADFYTQPADRITAHSRDLEAAQAELNAAYARWAELDA